MNNFDFGKSNPSSIEEFIGISIFPILMLLTNNYIYAIYPSFICILLIFIIRKGIKKWKK
jgi:hypothetical protein